MMSKSEVEFSCIILAVAFILFIIPEKGSKLVRVLFYRLLNLTLFLEKYKKQM